jgi:hypothetical protein
MGERQRRDEHAYSIGHVTALMGLLEHKGTFQTVVDIISWSQDPGGGALADQAIVSADPIYGWMARRGPLSPDEELACTLWDFKRAMKQLPLRTQGLVALLAFGFTHREAAFLLGISQTTVHDLLWGARKNDGAVADITRLMNGVKDPDD